MDVGAWKVIPFILSLLLWIEPDISCTERLLYMFFQTGPQGCYHCFFAVFGYHMKQQFHIVSVITRLFPFQIPEPQNNGGVIFRPLSDPDLQVIHTPCLVLMMSFVTYIFPFPGHNSCLHMSLPLSLSYSSICPLFSRSHTTVFRFL